MFEYHFVHTAFTQNGDALGYTTGDKFVFEDRRPTRKSSVRRQKGLSSYLKQ